MFSLRRLPATLSQSVRFSSTAAAPAGAAPVPATTNENSSSDPSKAVVERPTGSVIQAGVINGMPGQSRPVVPGFERDTDMSVNTRRTASPTGEDLPTVRTVNAVCENDEPPLENRLGYSARCRTMGEPSHGLGQFVRRTAQHHRKLDILTNSSTFAAPITCRVRSCSISTRDGAATDDDAARIGTHVKFNTKEDAIHFCEKQGFEFYVQEPHKAKFKPKNYSSNYAYTNKPLRQVVTK